MATQLLDEASAWDESACTLYRTKLLVPAPTSRRRQLLEKQQARRAAAASATEENATAGISGSSSPAGLGVTALRHISFDVLQGLASLHDEGLTHGDVKVRE
jgi:hypothetical protein